jgi:hypothetical protein
MKFRTKILWTLFAWGFLLGFGIFIWVSYLFMNFAESSFGEAGRIIAGLLALLFFLFVYMRNAFRAFEWFDVQERSKLREKHRGIYRVLALPTKSQKPNNWCAEEITIGDYGWESKLLTKDGLIWLHGLSTEWKMAWRAGFKPEEVEFVCYKPISQYDWKDFEYDGPKPSSIWTTAIPKQQCPFTIQKPTTTRRLQFPVTSY